NLHSLTKLDYVLETSLTKTLAAKLRLSVPQVYDRYQASLVVNGMVYKILQVILERPGKKSLETHWGGIPLKWDIHATVNDVLPPVWVGRTELEKRLLAGICEYCGATRQTDPIQVHHIRALKDLRMPSGRDKPEWVKIMAARRRETMVLWVTRHHDNTHGLTMR